MDIFTQFVIDHEHDDTGRLLLGRGKWPDIDMDLAVHTIEGRRRMRVKMPLWHAVPGLRYPTRLCTEQCSSAATARYKASLAARILSEDSVRSTGNGIRSTENAFSGDAKKPKKIADLTGGIGVDARAFCEVAERVLHNEMDPVLSEAVKYNFGLLGISNAVFRNECAAPGRIGDILGAFDPDLIFLDPARRAGDGRKVFRLEDCQPDILALRDELFRHAPHLLLKLSPMADISWVVRQLNSSTRQDGLGMQSASPLSTRISDAGEGMPEAGKVREVHVVEADGECKELLVWLDRSWDGPFRLVICNADRTSEGSILSFGQDTESRAEPQFVTGPDILRGGLLFEPGKALSKAGLFNTLCDGTGLLKLARHTHLYLVSPAALRSGQDDCTPWFPAGWASAEGAESPGKDTGSTRKNEESTAKNAEATEKDTEATEKDTESPGKDAESPAKNEESPEKNTESPEKNTEPPAKNEESTAKNAESPAKNTESTGKDGKEEKVTELSSFGKLFRIIEIHPFSNKTAKTVGKAWPRADVTVKDLPLSSDELRSRLGVVSDAAVHIFGCRVTGPAANADPDRPENSRQTRNGAPKDSACLIVSEPVSDPSGQGLSRR